MKEYKIFTFYEKCIEKIDHWRQISDKKGYVKKNVRLQFGQNQKFLIYKLFRLIFVTSCIEGIFDFSKIEARFFCYRKKYFRLHFSPGRTKHAIFWEPLASCCCFKAKMKAKWSRLLKNEQRDSFGFVCHDFGGIFPKKMHFLTWIGKKLSRPVIEENG